MNDTQTSSRTTMWLPFVAGMAGAAVALLLAPRSGKETRQQLRQAATGAKEKASEGLDTAKASVEEVQKHAKVAKDRVAEVIRTKRQKGRKQDSPDVDTNIQDVDSPSMRTWEEEV